MPILRREVFSFVKTWNYHKIRRQKNRPNCVPGQPWVLYHHPEEAQDHAIQPNPGTVDTLLQDVAEYGNLYFDTIFHLLTYIRCG